MLLATRPPECEVSFVIQCLVADCQGTDCNAALLNQGIRSRIDVCIYNVEGLLGWLEVNRFVLLMSQTLACKS